MRQTEDKTVQKTEEAVSVHGPGGEVPAKPLSKEERKRVEKHLRRVKRQLYLNLISAYRGWWHWVMINRIKGIGSQTAVVLLPSCERGTNYLALLYLDAMLKSRKYVNAVILTHDKAVLKAAFLFSDKILKTVSFSRKKAEHLMQYYCLYEFNKRFIVASLDEPNGRNGSALIGKRGTTKEEIFVIGVYRVYPFRRPNAPAYNGSDPEVTEFLKAHEELGPESDAAAG